MIAPDDYRRAREHAVVFDLSSRGKVELTGADAAQFLHNLSTADVKRLTPGSGCEAFLCSAKAKTVARVWVLRTATGYWLDTDPGLGEKVRGHLDHFLISEQVEIADRSAAFALLHVTGPDAENVLGHTSLDGLAFHVCRHDRLVLPGFDLLGPAEQAPEFSRRLADAGAAAAGLEAYEMLRVEASEPVFGKEIDDERFVVEIGRKDAICYTKGCYLGQEPIVMARDRGHVNRQLRGLKLAGNDPVTQGSKVYRDGAEVGQVTSSVLSPRLGTAIALAYLRRGSWEPGTAVEVETAAGRVGATVASLPFAQLP